MGFRALRMRRGRLFYTSDAADERARGDLGGGPIIKKKKKHNENEEGGQDSKKRIDEETINKMGDVEES